MTRAFTPLMLSREQGIPSRETPQAHRPMCAPLRDNIGFPRAVGVRPQGLAVPPSHARILLDDEKHRKAREYQRMRYYKNIEASRKCVRERAKKNYNSINRYMTNIRYKNNNPEKVKQMRAKATLKWHQKLRRIAIEHYSKKTNKCACCGESIYEFLQIDHINNDGGKRRREDPKHAAIYHWLKHNNYPEGFQVLCVNCNFGKRLKGGCPHQQKGLLGGK